MRTSGLLSLSVLLVTAPTELPAQAPETVAVAPDSPRWQLQGRTQVTAYLGRTALLLDGGTAGLSDYLLEDGVIDVDVATPASRGFFGIQFRSDSVTGEFVYLRQHKSGQPDAMQYTPILNNGLNWQLYSGPGFIGPVGIPRNAWFHLRLEVVGSKAKLYVSDMNSPALTITDLKSGLRRGELGLAVLTGATYFSNFTVTSAPASVWKRELPPTAAGTLVEWSLSPSYDALQRNLEKPLSASDVAQVSWQEVQAEPPGLVTISRYRSSPRLRVTFQSDFSTRLDPQPGMKVVYARTSITSDRDEVRKLALGYSDDVTVFLNGRILYRGRSAQSFRDPAFLGIVDPENDAVYLPLRTGNNELILAVSELGGGWGFVARLEPRLTP